MKQKNVVISLQSHYWTLFISFFVFIAVAFSYVITELFLLVNRYKWEVKCQDSRVYVKKRIKRRKLFPIIFGNQVLHSTTHVSTNVARILSAYQNTRKQT
jgi:hypothetical protein